MKALEPRTPFFLHLFSASFRSSCARLLVGPLDFRQKVCFPLFHFIFLLAPRAVRTFFARLQHQSRSSLVYARYKFAFVLCNEEYFRLHSKNTQRTSDKNALASHPQTQTPLPAHSPTPPASPVIKLLYFFLFIR